MSILYDQMADFVADSGIAGPDQSVIPSFGAETSTMIDVSMVEEAIRQELNGSVSPQIVSLISRNAGTVTSLEQVRAIATQAALEMDAAQTAINCGQPPPAGTYITTEVVQQMKRDTAFENALADPSVEVMSANAVNDQTAGVIPDAKQGLADLMAGIDPVKFAVADMGNDADALAAIAATGPQPDVPNLVAGNAQETFLA